MKIKIIKGVEMPLNSGKYKRKYPFADMEVTDMFEIPYDRLIHQSMYSAIKNFRRIRPTWKFRIFTNKEENWIKVFRTE